MRTMRSGAALAAWAGLTLALAFGGVGAALAAESCSSFQKTCAARCQQRLPGDKDCVPDHCTPKLNECRSTGCWQEGKLYGGALTCNLKKS